MAAMDRRAWGDIVLRRRAPPLRQALVATMVQAGLPVLDAVGTSANAKEVEMETLDAIKAECAARVAALTERYKGESQRRINDLREKLYAQEHEAQHLWSALQGQRHPDAPRDPTLPQSLRQSLDHRGTGYTVGCMLDRSGKELCDGQRRDTMAHAMLPLAQRLPAPERDALVQTLRNASNIRNVSTNDDDTSLPEEVPCEDELARYCALLRQLKDEEDSFEALMTQIDAVQDEVFQQCAVLQHMQGDYEVLGVNDDRPVHVKAGVVVVPDVRDLEV